MPEKNSWQAYFDGHAPRYMQNPFTYGTLREIDFLLEEMELPGDARILDVGCGTGRHSIELAKHGFRVTGVDISVGMLAEAEKTAGEEGVKVELIHSDASRFKSEVVFDAAVCLCEGAFCLLGADDDPFERDLAILRNVFSALKPGGKFIMTALNGLRPVRSYEKGLDNFDPVTMVETNEMESEVTGEKLIVRERSYVPTELALFFRITGFDVLHIFGGTAGNWGRRPLDPDEMEMMIIAGKPLQ